MTFRRIMMGVSMSSLTVLTACSSKPDIPKIQYDNLDFKAAKIAPEPEKPVRVVKLPDPLPLPGQLKPQPKKISKEKTVGERITDANKMAKIEPTKDGYINAIQNYPYVNGALYQLYAAVNQVSDITLQPGEKLKSVSAGDTVRWVVGDTTSGSASSEQVHILVKPIAPDLKTNLVIATDRRTYHLELHSNAETYMASVSWTYPHDELIALNRRNAQAESQVKQTIDRGLDLNRLRFRYRIEGEAPWKPIRAFDDGKKVYIQFPSGLSQGDAPPLFILSEKGEPALVNYRVRDTFYVVDRLFAAAELRLGEKPQQIVRIFRTDRKKHSSKPDEELFHVNR